MEGEESHQVQKEREKVQPWAPWDDPETDLWEDAVVELPEDYEEYLQSLQSGDYYAIDVEVEKGERGWSDPISSLMVAWEAKQDRDLIPGPSGRGSGGRESFSGGESR